MLIEFVGEEVDLSGADRLKLEFAVSELLIAHTKGHHYAIFHRATSKWMLTNLQLGARELATLRRLSADFAQSAILLERVDLRVQIDPSHKSGIVHRDRVIIVGLDDLQSNYFFDRAALIVEDQETDGRLFLEIARAARKKISAPNISLDVRHGGGERSKDVLLHLARERRIALLVTDSDRAYPQEGKPAKVLRYVREVRETGWGLAWVECTPCRELENLIPLSVIEMLPCKFERADDIAGLAAMRDRETSMGCRQDDSFWWYYDLKKGIDREKLERVSHDALRIWTTEKLALAPSPYIGFGESIVAQLLGNHGPLATFLSHIRSPEWWDFFGDLIRVISQFGFAPPVQRT